MQTVKFNGVLYNVLPTGRVRKHKTKKYYNEAGESCIREHAWREPQMGLYNDKNEKCFIISGPDNELEIRNLKNEIIGTGVILDRYKYMVLLRDTILIASDHFYNEIQKAVDAAIKYVIEIGEAMNPDIEVRVV